MNDKIRGIILSCNDYRENDALLSVLCKDLGLITLVSKGSQKMSSHHHFLPFCLYEFIIDYKDNKTMFTPRSFKLVKAYYDDDMLLNAYRNIFTECLIKNKDDLNNDDYDYLSFVLDNLNKDNMYLLGSLFFAYLLKKNGLSPYVDGCVECGDNKVIGLSFKDGGFVCKAHAIESDILEVETLKKFRLLNKANKENFELIKDNKISKEIFNLFVDFYLKNSDTKLDTYHFFKML